MDGLIHEETIKPSHPDAQQWRAEHRLRAVQGR
jgi:hypothetical protein